MKNVFKLPATYGITRSSATCFISGDGELIAWVAVANDVLGHHADVVSGRRVEINDGGLIELW